MKLIKYFETFVNENEEAEKKDFENLPRLKPVIDKEFFGELKEHVFYWLTYDFLNKKYTITELTNDENEVTVWFCDKDKLELQYKVTFTTIEDNPLVEKVEEVKMLIWIYEYETQELLKHTEMKLVLKYLNCKSFDKFINQVKKRIIKTPQDGEDIEDFKKKEKRRLGDNIY